MLVTLQAALDLFLIVRTVAASILEVFLLCFAGYLLARKGIISTQSKTTLNQINVSFFTPALMFSKVAFSLTVEKLAELYIVPVGFILTTSLSALLAWLVARFVCRLGQSEVKYSIAVSMFMNSNSLPIALVTSLIGNLSDGLQWGQDDNPDKQLGRSITYLVVFSTLGLILRWSYGVSLLQSSTESPKDSSPESVGLLDGDPSESEPEDAPATSPPSPAMTVSFLETEHPRPRPRTRPSELQGGRLRRPIFQSFPNVAVQWPESIASSRPSSISDSEDDAHLHYDEEQPSSREILHNVPPRHQHHFYRWVKHYLVRPLRKIHQFMTPPLYASLLSLVVVCVPPLQDWLETIQPLRSALKSAGNVSVPLTLVVLGAYFYSEKPSTRSSLDEDETHTKPLQKHSHRKIISSSLMTRHILTPLLLIPLLLFTLRWIGKDGEGVHEDPCFVLVSVLLIGAPPAITLSQMVSSNPYPKGKRQWKDQEFRNAKFRKLVGETLLVSYVFMTPICTVGLVVAGVLVVRHV